MSHKGIKEKRRRQSFRPFNTAGKAAPSGSRSQDAGNFLWNSIGGTMNAFQSVVVLMVITRACGLEAAGIFSIAYATANLLLNLGNYGVRNYQVSDLKEEYSFADYVYHRCCTVLIMLIAAAVYTAWTLLTGSYSLYKAGCVMAMCFLKAVDCAEEVCEGRFQQRGRLDRSGQLLVVRLTVSIGGMMIALAVTGDLLISTWVAVVLAVIAAAAVIVHFRDTVAWRRQPLRAGRIGCLMKACFPVCASNVFSILLTNVPKYAIDAVMDETAQACYNFIAMPVFVIQLLNMFIYQPLLIRMTMCLETGKRKEFLRYFRRIVGGLFLIAVPVLLVAWLFGIPVLSWLYATNLTEYRLDLMIILVGGIFLAFNGFYSALLTIMRVQNRIPLVYLAGCILSLFLTPAMVRSYGIRGAVLAYVAIMALVTVMLTVQFAGQVTEKRFGKRRKTQ